MKIVEYHSMKLNQLFNQIINQDQLDHESMKLENKIILA